jgi:beta-glucosidase
MTQIILGSPSPIEEDEKAPLDIKQASHHRPVVTPPTLTPARTPEEKLPEDLDAMAGKKAFSLERPDDRARELAAKLTLEEQVGVTQFVDIELILYPPVYPSICYHHVLKPNLARPKWYCPHSVFLAGLAMHSSVVGLARNSILA